MQALWDRGSATARDITEELNAEEPIAHSTVQTLLRQLQTKGAVTYDVEDRTFVYRPLLILGFMWLGLKLGRPATLDDITDVGLDHLAELGFDWVWLLSVWQTGPAAQAISRANPGWRHEFAETLPDGTPGSLALCHSFACNDIGLGLRIKLQLVTTAGAEGGPPVGA
jgi:hypothetical protein